VAEAVAMLSRRPLTRHELRVRMIRKGCDPCEADLALDRLEAQGVLDDAELARHWIDVRSKRRGHGPARLVRELTGRGVDAETVGRVLDGMIEDGDLEPDAILEEEAARRMRALGGRRDRRAYARVYNALLRAGHEARAVREVLDAHFRASGIDPEDDLDPHGA
jgi:regulatory protein